MNWVDIIILIIIGINLLTGLRKGLIRSVFGLIAILLAVFISVKGLPIGVDIIKNSFKFPLPVAYVFSFAIVFMTVYFSLTFLGNTVHQLIKTSFFAPANFIGGAILGLIKGVVIILFLVLPILNSKILAPAVTVSLNESSLLVIGAPLIKIYSPMVRGFIESNSERFSRKNSRTVAVHSFTKEDNKPLFQEEKLDDNSPENELKESVKKEAVKYIIRKTVSDDLDF